MSPQKTFVLDGRSATSHFPGIGRYVRSLAGEIEALLQEGESLAVILNPGQEDLANEIGRSGAAQILPVDSSPFSIRQQWEVPRVLGPTGARLYHSPYYLMPYRPGIPTVLTVYDLIPLRYPRQVSLQARSVFRWATALALRSAGHIIAISQSTSDDFQRAFDLPAAEISVIPLAAGSQFKPQSREEIQRVRDFYSLQSQYILYFGINKPHKNLDRLIQAVAYAALNGESLRAGMQLVIAGAWDPRYPEAVNRARELGLGDRVRFLGPVPEADLPGLYSGASAFIFPSLYEGFGLPVLEAMACGVPVACANTSSLAEIASDSAALFDPLSPKAIAEALLGLLSDPDLQRDLIQRGFLRAAEYSWRRTAEATIQIYRSRME